MSTTRNHHTAAAENSGHIVAALEKLQPHDHLCLFYENTKQQFETIIPFIQIGLARGEECIYLADDRTVSSVPRALQAGGINVDQAVASGSLKILSGQEAYRKSEYRDRDPMTAFLQDAVKAAKTAGYKALRIAGEMTWALNGTQGLERLIDSEAKLNTILPDQEALVLCQYDRTKFSPKFLRDIIATHPQIITDGTVCRNFYYVPPAAFFRETPGTEEIERLLANIRERELAEEALRLSEFRFRTMLDFTWDWEVWFSPQGKLLYTSPSCERITGYQAAELLNNSALFLGIVHPEDRDAAQAALAEVETGQPGKCCDIRLLHRGGAVLWVSMALRPVRSMHGEFLGARVSLRDITGRKQAEGLLAKTNDLLETILGSTHLMILYLDPRFAIQKVNRAFAVSAGREPSFYTGKNHFDLFPSEMNRAIFQDVVATGSPYFGYATLFHYPERGTLSCDWSLVPVKDAQGAVTGLVLTLVNVTAREEAQRALRESEDRYRRLLNTVTDYIYTVEMQNGKAVRTTHGPHCVAITGYANWEYEANPGLWYSMIHQEDRGAAMEKIGKILSGEQVPAFEHRIMHKDGTIRWIRHTPVLRHDHQGKIVAYDGLIADITERKQVEIALRESEERYRAIVEGFGGLICICSPDYRIEYMNDALVRHTGRNAVGEPCYRVLYDRDSVCPWCRNDLLEKGETVREEIQHPTNGRWYYVVHSPLRRPDGRIAKQALIIDITDRKKLEESLILARNLESLGTLAGGVAHDFNNLLTVILGNISFVKLDIPPDSTIFSRLDMAERVSLQARDLANQLITFSRGGEPVRKALILAEPVRGWTLFALSGSPIKTEFSVDADLRAVDADEGQLRSVIHAIVTNAREAMSAGGHLAVRMENRALRADEVPPLAAGMYVRIAIEDHGSGIAPEYLAKIFDPYFTTKGFGNRKGMGLGLTIAHSIIRKHGGQITVQSTLGKGTVVSLYLPVSAGVAEREQDVRESRLAASGRVLVMDDDEDIRQVTREMLRQLGYDAESASDGAEAVERYDAARAEGRPFDAVLLDMTIRGGMGGLAAVEKLRAVDPDVRAVITSGYSHDPVLADYRRYGFRAAVVKPYRIAELRRTLSRVLSDRR